MSVYSRNQFPPQDIEVPKNYGGIYFSPARGEPIGQKVHRPPSGPPGRTLISRERGFLSPVSREEEPDDEERRVPPPEQIPEEAEATVEEQPVREQEHFRPRAEAAPETSAIREPAIRLDPEELLIAGLLIVLLREGTEDWLPLALALLLT